MSRQPAPVFCLLDTPSSLPGGRIVFPVLVYLVLTWVGVAGVSASAKADSPLTTVLGLLSEISGVDATFEESRVSGFLTTELKSSGEIEWRSPDTLTKRTLDPFEETIAVRGNEIHLQRVDDGRVRGSKVSINKHPEIRSVIDSVRDTLSGDRRALESLFALNMRGSPANWTLELTPQHDSLAKAVERITLTGASARIETLHVLEADGDESTLTLNYTKTW